MSRILIGTQPLSGHVNPAIPIVRQLVQRGHEVVWYTGRAFQSKIEATGALFVPIKSAVDLSVTELNKVLPDMEKLEGIAQVKMAMKHIFIDQSLGHFKDCLEILKEYPADVLLSEPLFVASQFLHERTGLLWANFGDTMLAMSSRDTAPFGTKLPPSSSLPGRFRNHTLNFVSSHLIFREVNAHYNLARLKLGLPKGNKSFFDSIVSPYLYLQGTVPSFEYPRSDLPPQVHFVGPLLDITNTINKFTPPAWWDKLNNGFPVIHVTQGTVNNNPADLIVPTLKGLASEQVLVVATTGGSEVGRIGLDPLPANALVEPFLPHINLLPNVDIMITNGGYGAVQMALAHGIPLIVAGTTEDKPEVAARIEWSGVGINLKTKNPTPEQIREAVTRIRTNPAFREKARQIQQEMAQTDPPTTATLLLEELISTHQPVSKIPQLATK